MTTDSALMLNHFFRHEQRVGSRWRAAAWGFLCAVVLINFAAVVGAADATTNAVFSVAGLIAAVGAFRRYRSHRRLLEERLTRLLRQIDLDWSGLDELPLTDEQREAVHQAFSNQFGASGHTNEAYLRTRGSDAKGPAFDGREAAIDPALDRVDPALHERDYDGLEDELRVSEQLLEEADQRYGEEAARQWAIAEKRDMDNIEAGVQRLGDLVASGWFERNAKDGAMAELMEEKDPQ